MTDLFDAKGYFSLFRQVWKSEGSPLEEGRRFTEFEAWLFMLSEASYAPRIKDFHGFKVSLGVGELVFSLRHFSSLWNWDKKTVAKTLDKWAAGEDPRLTVVSKTGQWTTAKINKYATYQGKNNDEIPSDSPADGPVVPQCFPSLSNNKKLKTKKNIGATEQAQAPLPKAEKAAKAPEAFQITESHREWATGKFGQASWLDEETEKFLDYHRAKGSRFKDWDAAWKNWMRNAVKWNKQPVNAPGVASTARVHPMMGHWKADGGFLHEPTGVAVPAAALEPHNHRSGLKDLSSPTGFKSLKTGDFDYFGNFEIVT
jgi:hypothetical protein